MLFSSILQTYKANTNLPNCDKAKEQYCHHSLSLCRKLSILWPTKDRQSSPVSNVNALLSYVMRLIYSNYILVVTKKKKLHFSHRI